MVSKKGNMTLTPGRIVEAKKRPERGDYEGVNMRL